MSGLKFILSDVTSILPDNLLGLKNYIQTWGNRMTLPEWTDADGTHYWRSFRNTYKNLVSVEFEPKITKWAIRPW